MGFVVTATPNSDYTWETPDQIPKNEEKGIRVIYLHFALMNADNLDLWRWRLSGSNLNFGQRPACS